MLRNRLWITIPVIIVSIFLAAALPVPGKKIIKLTADNQQQPDDYFLAISDIHLDDHNTQQSIGLIKRDAGADVWKIAKEKIAKVLAGSANSPKPKFIICLGDLPFHAKKDNVANAMKSAGNVLKDLKALADKANVPLLFAVGNNDSPTADYGPFSLELFKSATNCNYCWPVTGISSLNHKDSLLSSIGCYAAWPLGNKSKLRVISLNTTVFTERYTDKSAAAKELKWLGHQLESARLAQEKVIIAMHVPPGVNAFVSTDNKKNYFWDIRPLYNSISIQDTVLGLIDRYKSIITCLLSSHTHMDGISKLLNREGTITSLMLSVPAIAPSVFNNPAMDLVRYNPRDFAINNFVTLYAGNIYGSDGKIIPWGNNQFDFKKLLGSTSPGPLDILMGTLNEKTLEQVVTQIYHPGTSFNNDPLAVRTLTIEFIRKH